MNTNDFAKAFDALMQETPYVPRDSLIRELLMQTTPGFEHFDSGADGILPECRSCRFHRPFWKYQSCVFAECPYCCNPVSTLKNQSGTSAAGKEVNHG